MVFERSSANPVLTRADVPNLPPDIVDATSVFNPGAASVDGRYALLLRVQTRARETFFMTAWSLEGESFQVTPEIVRVRGLERAGVVVRHVYDPRITVIEGEMFVMFALDTDGGCRLGVARTADLASLEFLGLAGSDDSRNGVLFPEKLDGTYLRLDRPNRRRQDGGPVSGDEIWLSRSDDLMSWQRVARVMSGRPGRWDELIGSGPPPIKTRHGWLHVYHGIATHFQSFNIYQAGAVILDLDDPSRIVARTHGNVLEPREPYELVGQVPNVVFPSGLTVDAYDGEGFADGESAVRLYYGAADTCVCVATSTVNRLISACQG